MSNSKRSTAHQVSANGGVDDESGQLLLTHLLMPSSVSRNLGRPSLPGILNVYFQVPIMPNAPLRISCLNQGLR